MTSVRAAFIPWEESALLPSESLYALFSKVAWYSAKPPVKLIGQLSDSVRYRILRCRPDERGDYPLWMRNFPEEGLRFLSFRKPLGESIARITAAYGREVPTAWQCASLRVCADCIATGVHLRIHQHTALARCPVHETVLTQVCQHCGSELFLGYKHWKARAFACDQCQRSLLRDDGIVTRHSETSASVVAKRVSATLDWLHTLSVSENLYLGSGRGSEVRDQHLLLGALYRASRAPPRAIAEPDATHGRLELVQIAVHPCRLCHAIRAGKPNGLELFANMPKSQRWPYERKEVIYISVSAHRLAARRVTAYFLSRFPIHTACLSAPHIAWEWLEGHAQRADALARCCPMAIGFWAWRKATQRMHLELTRYTRHHVCRYDDDLLIPLVYTSLRSLLHYCIATASDAVHEMSVSGKDRRKFLERMRDLRTEALWSAFRDPWAFGRHGKYAQVVRFDASALLRQIECPDAAELEKTFNTVLGERFSAMSPLRAAVGWYVPHRGEWVLMPPSWLHRLPPYEAMRLGILWSHLDDWRIVTTAISRRERFA